MSFILPDHVLAHLLARTACKRCGKTVRSARVAMPTVLDHDGLVKLSFHVTCECGQFEGMTLRLPRAMFYAIVGHASYLAWTRKPRTRKHRLAASSISIGENPAGEEMIRRCQDAVVACAKTSTPVDADAPPTMTIGEITASYLRMIADWVEATRSDARQLIRRLSHECSSCHREPPGVAFTIVGKALRDGVGGILLAERLRLVAREEEERP